MDDIISAIKSSMKRVALDYEEHLVMNSRYRPLAISERNFHPITECKAQSVLFVDGGNATIFEGAGFCVSLIRVAAINYLGKKRVARHLEEFYIFVKEEADSMVVKTFPKTTFDGMTFNPDDESLRSGIERSDCSRIVSVVRRLAEIEHAASLDDHGISLIALDGTLEARYPHELDYLRKLFATGKACALSKTCSLITNAGVSITKRLDDFSQSLKLGAWHYDDIVINNNPMHDAQLHFVRFHKDSKYIFRFELQEGFAGPEKAFSALALCSIDPVFLGYPYGFIDADALARVSEEERSMLQARMSVKMGKDWNEFSKHLSSLNAHDILDKIRF